MENIENKTTEELEALLTDIKSELAARGTLPTGDGWLTLVQVHGWARDNPDALFESVLYPLGGETNYDPYKIKNGMLYEVLVDDNGLEMVCDRQVLDGTFRVVK